MIKKLVRKNHFQINHAIHLNISMGYDLNSLSNDVNGFNSSKKRIKMFEYLREKITNNGILFLQETHSSYDTVINWCDDFKGELFFSHEPQIHAAS